MPMRRLLIGCVSLSLGAGLACTRGPRAPKRSTGTDKPRLTTSSSTSATAVKASTSTTTGGTRTATRSRQYLQVVQVEGARLTTTDLHTRKTTSLAVGDVSSAAQDPDGHWWVVRPKVTSKGTLGELVHIPSNFDLSAIKTVAEHIPADVGKYVVQFPDETAVEMNAFSARRAAAEACGSGWNERHLCDEAMGWTERKRWTLKLTKARLQQLGIAPPAKPAPKAFISGSPPSAFQHVKCDCWGDTGSCGEHTQFGDTDWRLLVVDVECGDLVHPSCVLQSADGDAFAEFSMEAWRKGLEWIPSREISKDNYPAGPCGPFMFTNDGAWITDGNGRFCTSKTPPVCKPKLKGEFLGVIGTPLVLVQLQ
jgi:hypothetical protein